MSEQHSQSGQRGQADPNDLVQRMLTSLVQHAGQIPRDKVGEVERGIQPIHQAYLQVSGLTQDELAKERGTFATVDEPSGSRLSQKALQWALDILYLVESSPRKDNEQFRQTSVTAIQQIQPMLTAAGQQAPAQAEQFMSAQSGGQSGQRRPGSAS